MPLTFVLTKPTCEFIRASLCVHMTQWLGARPFLLHKGFCFSFKKKGVSHFLNKEDSI
jgi:hypothetical protein